jgi:DNA-binding winged helix-turn-helix (wHTH) protein
LDANSDPALDSLLFADFELRLHTHELFRAGRLVKLQQQPARVLAGLALQAGTAVSRQEIRRAVWGEETHLDFDLALNYGIRQIRRALGDSTEQPRFIETLPRFGYRFIAPVEVRRSEPPEIPPALPPEPLLPVAAPGARIWRSSGWVLAAVLGLLLLSGLIALRSRDRRKANAATSAVASIAAPIPPEAMRAYLEGQYFAARDNHEKARDAFRRVTKLAPKYAPAWAELAHELLEDEAPARELEPILEAAERQALALDPALALGHLDRAERLFRYEYAWDEAEREYRNALELDPQSSETHYEYALMLSARGRHDEALKQVEHARYLEPNRQLARARYPWIYFLARRYDEAVQQARAQIALAPGKTSDTAEDQPEMFWAYRVLTLAALALGDQATALEGARGEAHWLGDPLPATLEEHWRFKARRFAEVGPFRPWFAVVPAIELGDRERAIDLLLQECRDRSDTMIAFLAVDPLYDSLRSQPRFRELLRCANLAPAPAKKPAG